MQIAVASGKGGTGKTLIATNLAIFFQRRNIQVTYLDCDVEAPNGHLYLNPVFEHTQLVELPVPVVNKDACTHCGLCNNICQFNAIVSLPQTTMVFPELCHGCFGCKLVCKSNAISFFKKPIGKINKGTCHGIRYIQGLLDIGQALSPPLIHTVRKNPNTKGITIIDAPPGTSCPAVESVRHADYTVLVTEASPFGFHDLKLAVEMIKKLNQAFGIIINKSNSAYQKIEEYIQSNGLNLLATIPENRTIAESYSRGDLVIDTSPEFAEQIALLHNRLSKALV